MNVLIVYAHQEPTSFNGALRDAAIEALGAAGHNVVVSDLYAQEFDAALTRRDFASVADSARFDAQKEQSHAYRGGGFAPDVAREMARLEACDLLIFQFPIYWFSVPAILKGWIDRVLAYRFAYGGGRWFETGAFAGKRAMIAVTTGAPAGGFGADGRYGSIDMLMWPVQWGTLRFCGFDVLAPQYFHGVGNPDGQAARATQLAAWRARLSGLFDEKPLAMPAIADFGPDGRVLAGRAYRHPGPPRLD